MKEGDRHFFLRDKRNNPVACVAVRAKSGNNIEFAVSTHNPTDKFSRDIARKVALGRLNHDATSHRLQIGENDRPKEKVAQAIVKTTKRTRAPESDNYPYRDAPAYPQRARDAARRWLRLNAS